MEEKEIKDAISQCWKTKSPQPNKFKFYFIKSNKHTIKNELCRAI